MHTREHIHRGVDSTGTASEVALCYASRARWARTARNQVLHSVQRAALAPTAQALARPHAASAPSAASVRRSVRRARARHLRRAPPAHTIRMRALRVLSRAARADQGRPTPSRVARLQAHARLVCLAAMLVAMAPLSARCAPLASTKDRVARRRAKTAPADIFASKAPARLSRARVVRTPIRRC